MGPDSEQKHFLLHRISNLCQTFKRVPALEAARREGVLSEKSGLHTAPLVSQTASARPEAVCFEFCGRESVKMHPSAMWLVSPAVRSTYTEDGAVLLDIGKGLCYSLNRVAARIWVTIQTSPVGGNLEGIVDALETHLETPREQLERDTSKYLEELRQVATSWACSLERSSWGFKGRCWGQLTCFPVDLSFPAMRVPWGERKQETNGSPVAIPESVEPGMCLRIGCAEIFRLHPASATSPQGVSGFRFLCCCQRRVPLKMNGMLTEEERWEEICLQTLDLPEPY
jgi:hypothetical protein